MVCSPMLLILLCARVLGAARVSMARNNLKVEEDDGTPTPGNKLRRAAMMSVRRFGNRSFEKQLASILSLTPAGTLQRHPKLFYDPGENAEFRGPEAIRCQPSFTKASKSGSCNKLAILLHGYTSCPGMWYWLAPDLRDEGFCVLRPTLPGHGYKPKVTSQETQQLTIYQDGWERMEKINPNLKRFEASQPFYTGLKVKLRNNTLQVVDVEQGGMMYVFNTLVSRFEIDGQLNMMRPGDKIVSIDPYVWPALDLKKESTEKHIVVKPNGELWLKPWLSFKQWFQAQTHFTFKIVHDRFEDDLRHLPTQNNWQPYVDFADRIANLAAAFKRERPRGEVILMGHSLGASIGTAAVVRAPIPRAFDRVLLMNPAYGVSEFLRPLLHTAGSWFPISIAQSKCEQTRYTLSTGGYCRFRTDHVIAVNTFGNYALCSLIQAQNTVKLPYWCTGLLKESPIPSAHLPIATHFQMVTTFLDAAIDNSLVNLAAEQVIAPLLGCKGECPQLGFCYLKGELTHNFLNELSSTTKRDFWWKGDLTGRIRNFFSFHTTFPLQPEEQIQKAEPWTFTNSLVTVVKLPWFLLVDIPWKLLKGASETISPPHKRCLIEEAFVHF